MSFRENLKNEITYSNMLVKELADRSGVSKRTIHSYLCENGSIPSAEAAVNIARALGVSVEYLVTGSELIPQEYNSQKSASATARTACRIMGELSPKSQKIVLSLIKIMREEESLGTR